MHVRSTDVSTEIRVALLGEWVPPQLADVLAMQRAEEPETLATVIARAATELLQEPPSDGFDFALSATDLEWRGWTCEPLWYDTLSIAMAERSHLLAYREVPCDEALKQPLIWTQSTADESWCVVAKRVFGTEPRERDESVGTFDIAMTLVAAGYGIAVAPSSRLAGYQHRGIALRLLANTPKIVTTYLLQPDAALSGPQARFIRRARSMS